MTKARRGPGATERDPGVAPAPDRDRPDPALAADLAAALGPPSRRAEALSTLDASRGAETLTHAATLLAVAPRAAAWTERLCERVARSDLPADRRDAIVHRLRGDQALADAVSAAFAARTGADEAADRSAWITVLSDPRTRPDAAAGSLDAAYERASSRLAVGAETVRGLVQDLALLVAFGWDEEDEGLAPPGDYAAEESGW